MVIGRLCVTVVSEANVQALAPLGRHCASMAGLMLKSEEFMEEK
jgi:hypothetical protein